ncbi:hypothetical protein FW778_05770 [Ginsengibacter hankyongi]|uniref:Uncharacterized protein n=1 Tax=Ginsengibacter hankyongi TaxID=2607284 RepID=A0A5J5ILY6_9BACT|nr:hypothetical protein [Ginsengibacter hankyongi]KAA9041528.1 hypothetical protein FW778_05770 [Ginsengibacter hankyongi]
MKTLLILLVSTGLAFGASAQVRVDHDRDGYHHSYRPGTRIIVSPSVGFGWGYGAPYPYYGYPGYGYPFGYPYDYPAPYEYRGTPYKLALQIQSIKLDYKNQIRDARHNKSMSHTQRREEIRRLKTERDQAIISAQQNFRYGNSNNRNYDRNNNQE